MSDSGQNQPLADEDHWEIYVTYVDEQPAVILVDIAVSRIAPIAKMPCLAWIWVYIRNPDNEGFPSDDENDRLNDIEDALTESLNSADFKYVGRVTTDGRREFYFYTEAVNQFRELATMTMKSVGMQFATDYEFEIDETDDDEWRHYWDVLYPTPEDFQQIRNQHVLNQLEQAGDTLTEPRPLDHFANFRNEEDRAAFIAAAEALGFEAVSRPVRAENEEFPYSVGLLRVDAVDPETVDRITFELWELASNHNGEYDGWGSTVIKP